MGITLSKPWGSNMSAPSLALYTNAQIRELERIAIETFDIAEDTLMARAGAAAYEALRGQWPEAKRIHVVCGGGNNGGDGYVIARLAHEARLEVTVTALALPEKLSGAAANAAKACQKAGLRPGLFEEGQPWQADVIVDALLGTGLKGEVRPDFQTVIEKINHSNARVLAIDAPSGLDVDTGRVLGKAVRAAVTVTFIGQKQGLYTGDGPEYAGKIRCHDLEIPRKAFTQVKPTGYLLSDRDAKHCLPPRPRSAHKGAFGHVLIVGGDYGMAGAARMAGEAAARVGAGLVSVATHPEHAASISAECPELMCHATENEEGLKALLERATTVVIGPGLGRSDWSQTLFQVALTAQCPQVIDADGLNWLSEMPVKPHDWVLTPHPGEASRLLHCATTDIQADRFAAVAKIQKQYGGVCVLKGAGTLVLDADHKMAVCPAGNPGMATGGMGDVLSGVIGGLLAQGLAPGCAARVGVYIHAHAGDLAAHEHGERGLIATDLMPYISQLANP